MIYVGIMNGLFFLRFALQGKSRVRVQAYYLVLAALFLFSAFRFEVGCDWSGYFNQFRAVESDNLADVLEHREVLWWALLYLLNIADLPYPTANVLSSAVFFFGIHCFAKRQPDRLAFLILLFPILIINIPMSGVRQGAAIGLLCIAFNAFLDRRIVHFVVWTVLAAGFHASALVFLLLVPLATGRYTRNRLAVSAILAIPGAFLMAGGESAQLALDRYVDTGIDAAGAIFRVGMLSLTGAYFFVALAKSWRNLFPGDYSLASLGSMGMVLAGLLVPISTVIGDRFGYYLIPIQCMIFARMPYLPLGPSKRLFVALPYLGLMLVFTYWTLRSYLFGVCYMPYQTWLFGFPDSDRFLY